MNNLKFEHTTENKLEVELKPGESSVYKMIRIANNKKTSYELSIG